MEFDPKIAIGNKSATGAKPIPEVMLTEKANAIQHH